MACGAGWQRARPCFQDPYSLCWVTGATAAFYTDSLTHTPPPQKDTSVFSNIPLQTCLLQNMMDKGWREKSSLMHLSVRVKHSIANLQAATQEQNVIISSQDQTSANLSSIRESWISFDGGPRPPRDRSSPRHHPHPCGVETRCTGLHGATAPFAQVPA